MRVAILIARPAASALVASALAAMAFAASASIVLADENEDRAACKKIDGGETSVAACTRWIAVEPHDATYFRLRNYFAARKWDEAAADATKLIELNVKDPKSAMLSLAYSLRARVYVEQDKTPQAVADLDAAIAADPKNVDMLLLRLQAHYIMEKLDLALLDGDKAVALESDNVQARVLRAQVNWEKGDKDKALADIKTALKLDPNSQDAAEFVRDNEVAPEQLK